MSTIRDIHAADGAPSEEDAGETAGAAEDSLGARRGDARGLARSRLPGSGTGPCGVVVRRDALPFTSMADRRDREDPTPAAPGEGDVGRAGGRDGAGGVGERHDRRPGADRTEGPRPGRSSTPASGAPGRPRMR